MTTTYTPTLQLSLQGTGDNNNTWGTVANLVFAQVDQAVNGYLSLSVAGNSNVTLTWPTGTNVSNQANNPTIQFTGALTGNITVFVPAASRRMFYLNATTGAYTLTIAVVGTPGTTVAIPQGSCLPLWTDGTNVYSGLASLGPASFAGNVTIAGSLGVGTTTLNAKIDLGSSTGLNGIYVFDDGTGASGLGISTNTLNVFSAGTTIAFGSGYKVSGGYTPSMYLVSGRLGIGTSTPSNILTVAAGNGDGIVLQAPATTYGPFLRIQNTGTGGHNWNIVSNGSLDGGGAGHLSIYDATGGGNVLITGNPDIGNVGIGTNTPGNKLTVVANTNGSDGLYITNTSTGASAQAFLGVVAQGWSGVKLVQNQATGNVLIYTADNVPLAFSTNATEAMRITAAGNVGIGTSNPDSFYGNAVPLAVVKNQNATTILGIGNNVVGASATTQINMVGGTGFSYSNFALADNSGSPYFTTYLGSAVLHAKWNFGSTEVMRMTAAGNVGIGTSSPTAKLTVSGSGFNGGSGTFISTTSGNGVVVNGINAAGVYDSAYIYLSDGTNSGFVGLTAQNAPGTVGSLRFSVAGTEYARIQPNGNVGIGTSAPVSTLTINGPGAATPSLSAAGGAVTISNNNDLDLQIGESSITGSAGIYLQSKRHSNDGTSWQLYLNPLGGSVGIGTSAPAYLLDVNGTGRFVGSLLLNGGTALSSVTNPANNPITGTPSSSTYLRGDGTWVTLAASATTDTTNASNVTSGTLPNGRLSGSYTGITGVGTLTAGAIGTGFTAIPNSALANSSVTINGTGVSLGGSATVTAAAGTLTGSTLASGVTGSSLTSVGTLGSLNVSGNVGIGTSSPGYKLQVTANTNGNDGLYISNSSTGASAQAFVTVAAQSWTGVQLVQNQASGNVSLYSGDNVPMLFATNGTERMRITAAGNVGIGNSNPDSFYGNPAPLAVTKNQNAATILGVSNSSTGASAFTQISMVGGTANSFANIQLGDNAGSPYFQLTTGSAVSGISMIANSNGVKLAVNGTSWSSVSDERLKTAIEPISNAAAKVSGLRSVIGKFKTDPDGVRRPFLMAQDVQAVLPEAVNVAKDGMGTLELSYTDVIPLLVAAINELTTRIAALETKGA